MLNAVGLPQAKFFFDPNKNAFFRRRFEGFRRNKRCFWNLHDELRRLVHFQINSTSPCQVMIVLKIIFGFVILIKNKYLLWQCVFGQSGDSGLCFWVVLGLVMYGSHK